MLYGTCKIISERLKMGNRYEKVVKVYSVNLLYFELGHGKDYVYHGFTQFRGIYQDDVLQNSPSQKEKFAKEHPGEIFPEYYLLRINQFDDVAKTPLDEWIYYLKNEALPKNYQAKGLSLVEENLKISKMDITQLKTYQKYKGKIVLSDSVYETAIIEGIHKGMQQGKLEGKLEGRLEGKTETIINAFKKGFDVSLIAELVNLSEDSVGDILRENGLI